MVATAFWAASPQLVVQVLIGGRATGTEQQEGKGAG